VKQWANEELIDNFRLPPKELDLIGDSKADHNLLGFAVLLKYFQLERCMGSYRLAASFMRYTVGTK
jgi:hypothetical protein